MPKDLLRRNEQPDKRREHRLFTEFAQAVARLSGKPGTFLAALAVVTIWAVTGPLFGYSDSWQLVINTGTTIITFLMVFIIQNTQNRDTLALQIKLSELIFAVKGAQNRLANIEELSADELEVLRDESRIRVNQTPVSRTHGKYDKPTEQGSSGALP